MRNDYVVYIHKNILNGKVYVGQTCNLSERWRNNGKNYFNSIKFYNAIKKYGWDNFTHEVVYSNLNKQAADKLEKELIHKYNSIEEGYINSQYHDYVELFKSWFGDNVDQKIIESAIIFWFKDVDCKSRNKVVSYFKEY